MTIRRLFTSLSPLARFALLTGAVMALLAAVLTVSQSSAQQGRARAESDAAVAARLSAARLPALSSLEGRLKGREARAFGRAVAPLVEDQGASLRLLNRAGETVFATDRRLRGSRPSVTPALQSALGGRVASAEVDSGRSAGAAGGDEGSATLVPYRASAGDRVLGAVELRRPAGAEDPAATSLGASLPVVGAVGLAWALLVGVAALVLRGRRSAGDRPAEGQLDALTGLPDRVRFRDVLKQATVDGKRSKQQVAVLLMDLDRFKEVNDTLGHFNGDMLLKRVGPRLRSVLRDVDTIARLGGDEFAIVMPGLADRASAATAAERVASTFEEPFVLGGLALSLEASVGIALYPEHGDRVDVLIHRADTAMYTAKTSGLDFAFYADEQEQGSRRRLALAGELRRAITDNQIAVHYQPKAHFPSGEVLGVEALARWEHPERGTILPGEFIPIAEQTNQLPALTDRVLEISLGQISAWRKQGLNLTVAVNLSVRNLLDAGLPAQLERHLSRFGVDPSCLELELTESMIMSDPRRAREALDRLKALGVGLSVDDFGTGYSSLAYLKDLPIDRIKIDKSFVIGMDVDSRASAIVRATVDLGRNLGLEVIAEGVETQIAYDQLAELGCDYAQGYLLAKPMPARQLAARVRELDLAREQGATESLSVDGTLVGAAAGAGVP